MSLAAIVRALGGDLYAGGRRANVPAPGHSPADRSVSLLLDGDRVIVHAFAGDDWRAVLGQLRRLGLVDGAARLRGGTAAPDLPAPSRVERQAVAAGLWRGGRPVEGTLADRHLRMRGVLRVPPPGLRFHPAAPVSVYAPRPGGARPALLAAVHDPAGRLTAVELTYLGPDGGRARQRLPRKTVGCVPAGSAVRLDGAAEILLVAEGVFSALSAGERFGLPAWALLSAGNLAAWSAPAGVRRVLIAADRGPAGEAAARRLAARLAAAGVAVVVRWPPRPCGDWNEAPREGSPEEGTGGAGRSPGWSGGRWPGDPSP